ncbi:MAG TPA: HAD hydrolase-like protein [Bryobacterales bacterium]|nr:HAD hydrolase-like protein [Bryobacterales bacterium]
MSLDELKEFQPEHEFFIGLDSDGCVFDSMEIKHKECFTPVFIKYWRLQAISKYARSAWEFVNLYSVWRGANRFPALAKVLDLLREWPEPMRRGVKIPDITPLKNFINSGVPQGNPALEELVKRTGDLVLTRTLDWSKAVNRAIAELVEGVPPFPGVRECLDHLAPHADLAVISGTPGEALEREWQEHNIEQYAAVIAGQEMGTKKEHLQILAQGKYKPGRTLMIGDAPGDLKAARVNQFLFFPINPGHEEECWQELLDQGLDRFFAGTFAGEYEKKQIAEFEKLLPETPPWKRG